MKTVHGGAFDPETIDLLRSVLDEAWDPFGPSNKPNGARACSQRLS